MKSRLFVSPIEFVNHSVWPIICGLHFDRKLKLYGVPALVPHSITRIEDRTHPYPQTEMVRIAKRQEEGSSQIILEFRTESECGDPVYFSVNMTTGEVGCEFYLNGGGCTIDEATRVKFYKEFPEGTVVEDGIMYIMEEAIHCPELEFQLPQALVGRIDTRDWNVEN